MLRVTPYPVAWRVEAVDNVEHCGFEFVRSVHIFLDAFERLTDTSFQFLLGKRERSLGSTVGFQRQEWTGEVLAVGPDEL